MLSVCYTSKHYTLNVSNPQTLVVKNFMNLDRICSSIASLTKNIVRRVSDIIPKAYSEDPSTLRGLYKWITLGLLIRFLFMPFAFNSDLISAYHRSYLIMSGGEYLSSIEITELIQSLFLFVYQFFLPLDEILIWTQSTYSTPDSFWLELTRNFLVYRSVFLFKVPYLIFDIASAFFFLHFFEEKRKGLLAFKFWMLNPIGIFAIYIWGRHESVTIFFMLLSLFFAKRSRPYLSLFSLGLGIYDRVYPLMFLPFYIFYLGKSLKKRVFLLTLGVAILLFGSATWIFSGLAIFDFSDFLKTQFFSWILGMSLNLASGQTIYIFIVSYALLIFFFLYFKEKEFNNLWKFLLITLLLFYATCYFNPQFFAWFTPLVALAICRDKKILELHLFQIFFFMLYVSSWNESIWNHLFASVNPFNLNLSPIQFLNNFFSNTLLLNLSRSVLSAISILMIGILLLEKVDRVQKNGK